jgi:hypothetical protein
MRTTLLAIPDHPRRAARLLSSGFWLYLVGALAQAQGFQAPPPLSDAARHLVETTPGLQVLAAGDRAVAFFGKPMARAGDPETSVQLWWAANAAAFGVEGLETRELRRTDLGLGEFSVFAYEQLIDGVPVENSAVRLLVRTDAGGSCVTLATAHLAPAGRPAPARLDRAVARAVARAAPRGQRLEKWTEAREVLLMRSFDPRFAQPVRCFKTQGWNLSAPEMESYSFYVDATTGALVHVQDEIDHLGTDGSVTGFSTPSDTPDGPLNPPVSTALAHLEIRIAGGGSRDFVYTDANGDYSIDAAGQNLVASLTGPYLTVEDHANPSVVLSLRQRPTSPDFVFNPTPDEATTAQVNAFVVANKVVDFYLQHHPALEATFAANNVLVQVNSPGVCHNLGGQDGLERVYLYGSGGGCANAAYSSAITHEFSHYVHDLLGIWPGGSGGIAFAEGYADCVSFLLFDSPFMAHDMSCTPDDYTRNPELHPVDFDNLQWNAPPTTTCAVGSSASPHYWGQLLSGVWWDTKLALQAGPLGPVAGRDRSIYLFTAWSLVTTGISSQPGLNPQSYAMVPFNLIEVLSLDDDNGDLSDGTPNQSSIEAAFGAHGMTPDDVPNHAVYLRGEVNGDGRVDISDAVVLLNILFGGGSVPAPTPCDRADTNSDGVVNIADATYLLNHLFSGGPPPAYPYPEAAPYVTTSACP